MSLGDTFYLLWPQSWGEGLWLLLWGAGLAWVAWRTRFAGGSRSRRRALALALLALAPWPVWLAAWQRQYVLPGMGVVGYTVAWAPLAALPWLLAAGWLGPGAALLVALVTGLVRAGYYTHTLATVWLELTLAWAAAWAFHQPYRTRLFRLLRHPLGAWVALAALAGVGQLAELRLLLLAPTVAWQAWLARVGELFVAAALAAGVYAWRRVPWGATQTDQPSPAERSLLGRFLARSLPLNLILAAFLLVFTLVGAYRFADEQVQAQIQVLGRSAAESVPTFLEQGQFWMENLVRDPQQPGTDDPAAWQGWLVEVARRSAFFSSLWLLDGANMIPVAIFPGQRAPHLTEEERQAVTFALAGVPFQVVTAWPVEANRAAWVVFVAPLPDRPQWVLLGRADLATNPHAQGVSRSLRMVRDLGGVGLVLDEQGRVLYPPEQAAPPLEIPPLEDLKEGVKHRGVLPSGERVGLWVWSALGRNWRVVVLIPEQVVQEQALGWFYPLVVLLLVVYAVLFWGIERILSSVIASLGVLTQEAQRIAGGDLEHALDTRGEDEVARLRGAFEYMRRKLRARLEELRRLLQVSQRVASSAEAEGVVWPVLEAAQAVEPTPVAVRVALTEEVLVEPTDQPWPAFGVGPQAAGLAYLDEQVLALTRQQDLVVVQRAQRLRWLRRREGVPLPEALLAVALRSEGRHYGALYLAFAEPEIPGEVVQYVRTLAGQLSLALANTRLLESIRLGKQRLEAILAASPDPILVLDDRGRLLLANPAAMAALGMATVPLRAKVEEMIRSEELVALLRRPGEGPFSEEVSWPDGRVFFATVVGVEGRQGMGRVCVLRDITRFKELDALKSEFVQTVSHDLRSPLTLVHGYATMLEMVGPLNDRQKRYVRQIIQGVEHMSRLVNNLLDLGRIESGLPLQLQMLVVEDLVRQTVEAMEAKAMQKRIRLEVDIAPDAPPLLEGDLGLLERALQNLVDNAIKYTPPEGRVTVRVRPAGMDRVQIAVEDTGVGIAPIDQARLFEKFYRVASREVQKEQGSGLGLAIVRSVVERHHGRVWVESRLGHGSVFTMELPLRQPTPQPTEEG